MDQELLNATLKLHLTEMRERLDQAAGIARITDSCAEAGNMQKAIEIALDVEPLVGEALTLLNAACLIARTGRS